MVEFRVRINPDWWTKRWTGNFKWENPLPLEVFLLFPSLLPFFPFALSFFNHIVLFYLVFFHEELIRQGWEEGPVTWSTPLSLDGMSVVFWLQGSWNGCGVLAFREISEVRHTSFLYWLFRALSQPVWLSPERPRPVFIAFLPLFTHSMCSLWSEIWFQRWSEPEAVASLCSSRPPGH